MIDLIYFSIFSFVVAAVASIASDFLALYPFTKCSEKHWVEKARRAYPARLTAIVNPFLLAAFFGTYGWIDNPSSPVIYLIVGAASAYIAAMMLWAYVEKRILERNLKISSLIKSHLSIWFLFYYPIWILILLLSLPSRLTPGGFVLHGVIFIIYCALAAGGSFMIAKALGLAGPGSSRLRRLIEETHEKLGVAPRRVYEISWIMVNALVYPITKMLVVSKSAMKHLTDRELKAILKHEFGHLAEPLPVVLVRMSGLVFLFLLFSIRQIYGTFGIIGVLVTLLSAFLGIFLLNLLARRMEERADTVAATEDDGTYAKTLEKIYHLNMLPAVNSSKKSPHPDLYDRMIDAGVSPDYPRPKPPTRLMTTVALVLSLLISFTAMLFF